MNRADRGRPAGSFERYFGRTSRLLLEFLDGFWAAKRRGVKRRPDPWGGDVLGRLAAFTAKGKLLRGGLVCLGQEMTGRRLSRAAVAAGAALELVQSALLIHDDIMDRDERRRGAPALHRQYAGLGRAKGVPDPDRFGESLGICAGEIALFMAFEALAGLPGPRRRAVEAQRLFAAEFALVGLGQMQDVALGAVPGPVSERQVLELYRFKTARYSFSLPLRLGWGLGGGDAATAEKLERCGEALGVLFQMKDDELGLVGDESVTGKPVGSDLRQGKKTLHYLRLRRRASAEDRATLQAVFGRPDAPEAGIGRVRDMAVRTGVVADLRRSMARRRSVAARAVLDLPVAPGPRAVLLDLLDFLVGRVK